MTTSLFGSLKLAVSAVAFVSLAGIAQAQEAGDHPVAVLELANGTVEIALREDLAPNHVERITTLANDGFYDGLAFHRVIANFMAQTGDPLGNGTGGSDLPDLAAEFSSEPFVRGTVGMARAASPDSANSQFFIVTANAPHLNGGYTLFGEVISGMEFVDAIKLGTGPNGMVDGEPDRIVSLRVTPSESE